MVCCASSACKTASMSQPKDVIKLTAGADAVVDVVGDTLARSIAATRIGGRIHLVGFAGSTTATIDIFDAIRHGVTIHVATAGNRQSFEALCASSNDKRSRPQSRNDSVSLIYEKHLSIYRETVIWERWC